MENVLETDQDKVQIDQSPDGHCSSSQQNENNETNIVEVKKVDESVSDEEIDLQSASSHSSGIDGSWEMPQEFALNMHKSLIPVGPEHITRPSTARTSKFVTMNKSTKLGFEYRPLNVNQPENDSENDSEQDSQEESDQADGPIAKRRKISPIAVPQRRSSRVANLKMSSSMMKRGRSKSTSKVDQRASKADPETKGKTTRSRKRSRSSARGRSRSRSARSKSARSKSASSRKTSKAKSARTTKRTPKRATKRATKRAPNRSHQTSKM
ncbi:unnamed protein product [Diamesa serratosioi]